MSMAARAISSRAVSSISLAGIAGMCVEILHPSPLPSPHEGGGGRLALVLALVAAELGVDGRDEGPPGSPDDVVGRPHGAPRPVAVAGGHEHAGPGRRALALVEDAHLVVEQAHLAEARIEVLERLAQGMVEGVHGAVARGRGVLGDAL